MDTVALDFFYKILADAIPETVTDGRGLIRLIKTDQMDPNGISLIINVNSSITFPILVHAVQLEAINHPSGTHKKIRPGHFGRIPSSRLCAPSHQISNSLKSPSRHIVTLQSLLGLKNASRMVITGMICLILQHVTPLIFAGKSS